MQCLMLAPTGQEKSEGPPKPLSPPAGCFKLGISQHTIGGQEAEIASAVRPAARTLLGGFSSTGRTDQQHPTSLGVRANDSECVALRHER